MNRKYLKNPESKEFKRKLSDKLFMIQFDQANRDYLTNSSMFLMTFLVSLTALLISILSLIFSMVGKCSYSVIVTIVFVIILAVVWIKFLPPAKKGMSYSKKVNDQLQKDLLEIYPEYNQRYH